LPFFSEAAQADRTTASGDTDGFNLTTAEALHREHQERVLSGMGQCPQDTPFRKVAVQLILDLGQELGRRPIVRIHSLARNKELNERFAQLVSFNAGQQRYAVKLLVGTGDPAKYRQSQVLVRGENLHLVETVPPQIQVRLTSTFYLATHLLIQL
jgi:hypothetical protein